MFVYCLNNPINLYDDTGRFCLPAAIIGGVLNAGLTIAGAYIDAYIDGEPVNGKDLATDVIYSFTSGFIQNGFGPAFISNMFNFIDVGYAFFSTASRGGSLDDAMLSAASSLINVNINSSISKHFGESTSDMISNAITTSISQAELQSLNHVGKAMVNNSTKSKTKKSKDSRTVNKSNAVVQNVHIHAFGAW